MTLSIEPSKPYPIAIQSPPPPPLPQPPQLTESTTNSCHDRSLDTFSLLFERIGFKDLTQQRMLDEQAKKAEMDRRINQAFEHIVGVCHLFTKTGTNNLYSPPTHLTNTLDNLEAAKTILLCRRKLPSDVSTEQAKSKYYINVLYLLNKEITHLFLLCKHFALFKQCKSLEQAIFETLPTSCICNKSSAKILPKWDLSSQEGYACYLVFTQKMQKARYILSAEEKEHLCKLLKKGNLSVSAQATYLALKYRYEDEITKLAALNNKFIEVLTEANSEFSTQSHVTTCRWITPLYGFLLAHDVEKLKTLSHYQFDDSQANLINTHYLPLYRYLFDEFIPAYLTRQRAIYEKCVGYLDQCVNTPEFHKVFDPATRLTRYLESCSALLKEYGSITQEPTPTIVNTALVVLLSKTALRPPSKRNKRKKNLPSTAEHLVAPESKPTDMTYLTAFQNPSGLFLVEQVKRWLVLEREKIQDIRTFTNLRGNTCIKPYEKLADCALEDQFLYHGFSPLVDSIASNHTLRQKYCLETEYGVLLFIQLVRPHRPIQNAVISYGLNDTLCFQRVIEVKSDHDFYQTPLTELAMVPHLEQNYDVDSADDKALLHTSDEVRYDPELETLTISDKKYTCQLIVFPLQTGKMPLKADEQ